MTRTEIAVHALLEPTMKPWLVVILSLALHAVLLSIPLKERDLPDFATTRINVRVSSQLPGGQDRVQPGQNILGDPKNGAFTPKVSFQRIEPVDTNISTAMTELSTLKAVVATPDLSFMRPVNRERPIVEPKPLPSIAARQTEKKVFSGIVASSAQHDGVPDLTKGTSVLLGGTNGEKAAVFGEGPRTSSFAYPAGPRIVEPVRPVYPVRARRLGLEGRVVLRLELDAAGRLVEARVLESAGADFDRAALKAVREARFAPASEQGRAVACVATLPIRFELSN